MHKSSNGPGRRSSISKQEYSLGTANRSLRLVGRQVPQIMSRAHLTTDVASELCTKGAEELAALNRAREVTSREVVDPYLARIEKINPSVRTMRSVTRRATTSACAPMLPIARGDRPPSWRRLPDRPIRPRDPIRPPAGCPRLASEGRGCPLSHFAGPAVPSHLYLGVVHPLLALEFISSCTEAVCHGFPVEWRSALVGVHLCKRLPTSSKQALRQRARCYRLKLVDSSRYWECTTRKPATLGSPLRTSGIRTPVRPCKRYPGDVLHEQP